MSNTRSEIKNMTELPPTLEKELVRLEKEFRISSDKLKSIVKRFVEELDEGLTQEDQNIAMYPTWVHTLPTGKEEGTVLTLDLGGTNLRVCKVVLYGERGQGKDKSTLQQEQYKVPDELRTGTADQLWTFVVEKLQDFIEKNDLHKEYNTENPMPLGFTFSYPATQSRLDHAILKTWTKGFDISGVEGQDVAQQLRDAIKARSLPLELICVVNDTVGAMIASTYTDPATIIGAIFGTGCNAAYMADTSSITKLSPSALGTARNEQKMAINCEYGAFDNAHAVLPMTTYDTQIDAASPRPGEQAFEKLSAGLYLGEITRRILVDLADRGLALTKSNTETLRAPYALDTALLSAIDNDDAALSATRHMLTDSLGLAPEDADLEAVRRVAEMVAVRGARLCACGIAAICIKQGMREGHVAADGSVANKQPQFKERWAEALGEILGEGQGRIELTKAEDGSGIGCGIIAVMEVERRRRG
jgi:hexokinase